MKRQTLLMIAMVVAVMPVSEATPPRPQDQHNLESEIRTADTSRFRALTEGDLPALQTALEKMSRGSRPSRSRLVSTYYDTAGRLLRRKGMSLRVRSNGRRHVQTVKSAAAGAGSPSRGEWEDAIKGSHPDPRAPAGRRYRRRTAGARRLAASRSFLWYAGLGVAGN